MGSWQLKIKSEELVVLQGKWCTFGVDACEAPLRKTMDMYLFPAG